ncbi:hypothetical protein [Polyangium fumosum]|uniref:Tetratricopeptide repeat protein n=1 Tax=Polyangium fumosum TaxID=889272 RepID=A0A4U1INV4_9BACT|nr:hypothetical protein [Polyangium fumosum]TKC95712.1 hypothetical protein E8A74_46825 [Polyangium fumosum]
MSAPASNNVPRHATHRYHTMLVVMGGFLLLLSVFSFGLFGLFGAASAGIMILGPLCAVLGGVFAVLGLVGRRMGVGVQIVNTSFDLINRGRFAEAEAHLDRAEQGRAQPVITCVAAVQRGLIDMRRGDIPAAIAHLDRAITSPLGVLSRAQLRMHIVNARGMRAFLRAASGERAGAREDIEAVRESPDVLPQGLGRVALAEAILLERAGDREALREHLVTHHELLFDATDRRERTIVRAFQRMLETTATSVYRKGAKRDADSEEPPLADWIAQVVPEAAPFVEVSGARPDKTGEMPAAEATEAAKVAVAEARKAAAKTTPARNRPKAGRIIVLWAVLVALFVAVYQVLLPSGAESDGGFDYEEPMDPTLPLGLIVFAVFAALVVVRVYWFLRARKESKDLFTALNLVAKGDLAAGGAALERLSSSRLSILAAQADLALARIAERTSDLRRALELCDRGLARLTQYTVRISASDILLPDLISERAFLLAAMDRHAEAEAELASLPPAYPFKSRALFRVRLLSRIRQGDLKGAAELATRAGHDLPLSAREELLIDTVRAATNPETAGAGEIPRIKRELRTYGAMRRWMETVAPDALAALERTAEDTPLDATNDRDARAEEEALAEAEAARAATRALVVPG